MVAKIWPARLPQSPFPYCVHLLSQSLADPRWPNISRPMIWHGLLTATSKRALWQTISSWFFVGTDLLLRMQLGLHYILSMTLFGRTLSLSSRNINILECSRTKRYFARHTACGVSLLCSPASPQPTILDTKIFLNLVKITDNLSLPLLYLPYSSSPVRPCSSPPGLLLGQLKHSRNKTNNSLIISY